MRAWRLLKDAYIVVRYIVQHAREIATQYAEQEAEYEKLRKMLKEKKP